MGTYPKEIRDAFCTYALHGIHRQTAITQSVPKSSVRPIRKDVSSEN